MGYRIFKRDKQGYQYRLVKGKKVRIHILAARKKYGELPRGFHVHHIDGNKDNNQHNNLILLHKKDHWRVHHNFLTIKKKR